MLKKMIVMVLILTCILSAAPYYYLPVELEEPDGNKKKALVSGDENGIFMHDQNGYLIIRNIDDDKYYYATNNNYGYEYIDERYESLYPTFALYNPDAKIDYDDIGGIMKLDYLTGEHKYKLLYREKLLKEIEAIKEEESKVVLSGTGLRFANYDGITVQNNVILLHFKQTKDTDTSGEFIENEDKKEISNLRKNLKEVDEFYNRSSNGQFLMNSQILTYNNSDSKNNSIEYVAAQDNSNPPKQTKIKLTLKENSIEIEVIDVSYDDTFFRKNKGPTTNPAGWVGTREKNRRMNDLIYWVLYLLRSNNFFDNLNQSNANVNEDSYIDNFTFLFRFNLKNSKNEEDKLLRPYYSQFHNHERDNTQIWYSNGRRIPIIPSIPDIQSTNYILLMSKPGVLNIDYDIIFKKTAIHEYGHNYLGLDDLYHKSLYNHQVRGWDVMCTGYGDFLGINKEDVGWVRIPYITEVDLSNNKFYLNPINSNVQDNPEHNTYKYIRLLSPYSQNNPNITDIYPYPNSTMTNYSEYFILEYRNLDNKALEDKEKMKYGFPDTFEPISSSPKYSIPKPGLLLTKVNEEAGQAGNAFTGNKNTQSIDPYKKQLEKLPSPDNECKDRYKVLGEKTGNLHNATFPGNKFTNIDDFGAGFKTKLDNEIPSNNDPAISDKGGLIIRNITENKGANRMEFDLFFFDSKMQVVVDGTVQGTTDRAPQQQNEGNHLILKNKITVGKELKLAVRIGSDQMPSLIDRVEFYDYKNKEIGVLTQVSPNNPVLYELTTPINTETLDIPQDGSVYFYAKIHGKKEQVETTKRIYLNLE